MNRLKMGLLVTMVRILWSTLYTVTNVSVICCQSMAFMHYEEAAARLVSSHTSNEG